MIPEDTRVFIDLIKEDAIEVSNENGLYYPVMIAQTILESDSGKSELSAYDNNLFGIKGLYKNLYGTKYLTWEDDGTPAGYYVYSNFRKYSSYKESIEDYAYLLRNGLDLDKNFYSGAWKENATMDEVMDFLTGTYATDRLYGEKIRFIIEKYNLESIEQELKDENQKKLSYQESREKETNIENQKKIKELAEKEKQIKRLNNKTTSLSK